MLDPLIVSPFLVFLVPMECFLEHFQNALFARDGFVIPQVCTDAVGIYQSGVSVRIQPLNRSVSRESGKSLKKQVMTFS